MEPVTLEEMLSARERRAERQRALLEAFGAPLVCLTMNIPGPVKLLPGVEAGFRLALGRVDAAVSAPVLYRETLVEKTGCEAYYAVDADPAVLKARMTALEDADDFGRLLDLDVLDADGEKRSRPAPRKCLLCQRQAQACARSRTHPVAEMTARVEAILAEALA